MTLFKDPIFKKYYLKKLNITNFNALITRIFIKIYIKDAQKLF